MVTEQDANSDGANKDIDEVASPDPVSPTPRPTSRWALARMAAPHVLVVVVVGLVAVSGEVVLGWAAACAVTRLPGWAARLAIAYTAVLLVGVLVAMRWNLTGAALACDAPSGPPTLRGLTGWWAWVWRVVCLPLAVLGGVGLSGWGLPVGVAAVLGGWGWASLDLAEVATWPARRALWQVRHLRAMQSVAFGLAALGALQVPAELGDLLDEGSGDDRATPSVVLPAWPEEVRLLAALAAGGGWRGWGFGQRGAPLALAAVRRTLARTDVVIARGVGDVVAYRVADPLVRDVWQPGQVVWHHDGGPGLTLPARILIKMLTLDHPDTTTFPSSRYPAPQRCRISPDIPRWPLSVGLLGRADKGALVATDTGPARQVQRKKIAKNG